MLLNSNYHPSSQGHMGVHMVGTLLNDVSTQMAASNLSRRSSRGSNAPRTGGSMRILKGNSASNSPRNSTTLNRRRTVIGDGSCRRRPVIMDQSTPANNNQLFQTPSQAPVQSRPLSWHPSAHPTYDAPYQQQQAFPSAMMGHDLPLGNSMDLSQTPVLFSNYGSPSSTFSPPSQPWTGYDQEFDLHPDAISFIQPPFNDVMNNYSIYAQYEMHLANHVQDTPDYTSLTGGMNPSIYSHFDWNNFAASGFENSTAPPTPENFLPMQHPNPSCAIEDSIPFHPLDDTEEGEVLVGMGLYDAPEKSLPDLQLDQYRSVMSQYLGSCQITEATGKGLKLEETWEPPASEDDGDEDDDEDGENDAEGSTVDEDEQNNAGQGHAPTMDINYQQAGWV